MSTKECSPAATASSLVAQIAYLKRAHNALVDDPALIDWPEFHHCIAGMSRLPDHQGVLQEIAAMQPSVPRIESIKTQIIIAMRIVGARLLEEMAKSKAKPEDGS